MSYLLGGERAVPQESIFDGLLLDGGTLGVDLPITDEVGIGGRHFAQALVKTLVAVMVEASIWACQRSISPWVCGWKGGPRT